MIDRSRADLFAVIMAGGSGTRFWPASRRSTPKQFLAISGSKPMIGETLDRIEGLVPIENVLVVAGADHVAQVREALPTLPDANILAEPVGRNTLPCVALAALEIERRNPDAVQVVLPADHVIRPSEAFRASVESGARVARETSALVTFGIEPTFPATGYGYIEKGAATGEVDGEDVFHVERFVEKPDLERAREFLASGRFLWNSGMFVWTTAAIVGALKEHAPDVYAPLAENPSDLADVYAGLPSVPVDVGIMERAGERRVLPIDYSWSDVGSWSALDDVHAADDGGNVGAGGTRVVAEDSTGCIVFGEGGSVTALVGVKDLVVVHANGATLVCPKDRAQDVRRIVAQLENDDPSFL